MELFSVLFQISIKEKSFITELADFVVDSIGMLFPVSFLVVAVRANIASNTITCVSWGGRQDI